MPVTATKLRQEVYEILDSVIETGQPVEIERKGHLLRIVATQPAVPSRLSRMVKRPGLQCDPEELVEIDWSKEWTPFL
jgi:antitoxin (DNA-binding transcriptional repressor) of toxin-antitoxin stability system